MSGIIVDHNEARSMVGTWFQISIKHCMVARLPSGETGKQALLRVSGREDAERWVRILGERHSGDHYLRVYAQRDGNVATMSRSAFAAYLKAGGGTYDKHVFSGDKA